MSEPLEAPTGPGSTVPRSVRRSMLCRPCCVSTASRQASPGRAQVVDITEMAAGIEAILRVGAAGSAQLYVSTDPAVVRWEDLEDELTQRDFRTALRDFVRAEQRLPAARGLSGTQGAGQDRRAA